MCKNDETDDAGKLIYTGDIVDNDSTEDLSYIIPDEDRIIEEVYGPPEGWEEFDITVECGDPADGDEIDMEDVKNGIDQMILPENYDGLIE